MVADAKRSEDVEQRVKSGSTEAGARLLSETRRVLQGGGQCSAEGRCEKDTTEPCRAIGGGHNCNSVW